MRKIEVIWKIMVCARKIDDIRKDFSNEWLLITVDEVDPQSGAPSKGTLISHNMSVEAIWEEAEKHREPVMVLFSDDWPEDLAACFLSIR